jgi:hypothetical protein
MVNDGNSQVPFVKRFLAASNDRRSSGVGQARTNPSRKRATGAPQVASFRLLCGFGCATASIISLYLTGARLI